MGYLEVKIHHYVLRDEMARVLLPPEAQGELPELLERSGIVFERYDPSGDPR